MLTPRAVVWSAVAIYASLVLATVLDERAMALPVVHAACAVLLAIAWASFQGIWRLLAVVAGMGVMMGHGGELPSAARMLAWMLCAWVALLWLALCLRGVARTVDPSRKC